MLDFVVEGLACAFFQVVVRIAVPFVEGDHVSHQHFFFFGLCRRLHWCSVGVTASGLFSAPAIVFLPGVLQVGLLGKPEPQRAVGAFAVDGGPLVAGGAAVVIDILVYSAFRFFAARCFRVTSVYWFLLLICFLPTL